MTPKEEYAAVLVSGMFWEFFPHFHGNWESDAVMFIRFLIQRKRLQNS